MDSIKLVITLHSFWRLQQAAKKNIFVMVPTIVILQDECELLLDMVGLGLGPKQLPYRGPGPPPLDWDGLSVAVWNVPRKTTQEQIVAAWAMVFLAPDR